MMVPADFWQSKELWAALIQAAAGCLQGLATVVAVWMAYKFGLRQMKRQTQVRVSQELRHRQADALQAAWGLLQCLSMTENGQGFLHYQQSTQTARSPAVTRYFLKVFNAQTFVFERLPAAFYVSGAGLHWHAEVKSKFFECRNLVYALLLALGQAHAPKLEQSESDLQPIHKDKMAQRIQTLYDELNDLLRREMQTVFAQNF